MTQIKVYTTTGSTTSTLPKELNFKPNMGLLAQARHILNDSVHPRLARAKTRSEVALSHKKIYKQKGTGGARHGAKSAHIFVGGGVVHGPTGEKRKLNLPTKMKKVALKIALINKFKAGKAGRNNRIKVRANQDKAGNIQ